MKRIFLILGLCISFMSALHAQEIISGTVIDEKNEPVPGARVEAVGRSEFAVTDIDGIFRFEVSVPVEKVKVSYVGYKSQTRKVRPDMVVKLNKGWRSGPQEYQWFAGASYAHGLSENEYVEADSRSGFSLRGGYLKNWGAYANAMFGPGDSYNRFVGFTVGGIRRLWCPLHFFLGAGYGHTSIGYQNSYNIGSYVHTIENKLSSNHFVLEAGFLFRFGKFGINAGSAIFCGDDQYVVAQWGFSYFF